MTIEIKITCEPANLAAALTEMLSAFRIIAGQPDAQPAPVTRGISEVAASAAEPTRRTRGSKPKDVAASDDPAHHGPAFTAEEAQQNLAAPAPPPPPPPPPAEVSVDELRSLVQTKIAANFDLQEKILATLSSVGIAKIGDSTPEQRVKAKPLVEAL